jgi:hypothetical protein
MFAGFIEDTDVRLVGVEAAGAASLGGGRTGVLHGSRSSILADEDGQIADATRSRPGSTTPGVGPEHAFLRDTGRAEYSPAPTMTRLDAFQRLSRLEGIIPALESSHALAVVESDRRGVHLRLPRRVAGTRIWQRCSLRSGRRRDQGPRHLPDGRRRDARPRRRSRRRGADIVEIGFPFSDRSPTGPVIRAAGERALAHGCALPPASNASRQPARTRRRDAADPMTYASLLEAYGWERFETDARAAARRASSSPTPQPARDPS